MALSEQLQAKLNLFNAQYGIEFDLENMEKRYRILSSLDSMMLQPKSERERNGDVYFTMVKNVLMEVLNTKTRISPNAQYGVIDLNIEKFVNEMEDLIKQKHVEDNDNSYKQFGGMKYKPLVEAMQAISKPYNQSIYLVWSYKLFHAKNEDIINDLKSVTNNATTAIDNGLNDQNYQRSDLANVVYAQRALEMVRGSRTGWWKFWHPIHNYRERKYYEALTSKVEEYTKAELPIDSILEETEELLLRNAYEKFERPKVDAKEEAAKNKALTTEEVLKKVINDPSTEENLINEILPQISKDATQPALIPVMLKILVSDTINEIKQFNKNFTNETKDGKTVETQMVEFLGSLYENLNKSVGVLGYNNDKDKVVAIQTIIDVTMKKISPIAIYPETLGQYAEGYILNNAERFKKYTDLAENSEIMVEAKAEYTSKHNVLDEDQKSLINDLGGIINDDPNVPVVPPVEKVTNISNPEKSLS